MKPHLISLTDTGHTGSHAACYLRTVNTCSTKITGEHLISDAVQRVVNRKKVVVSGLPWMPEKVTREFGFKALRANCLCKAHNSALSKLDSIAADFFRAIDACVLRRRDGTHFLFSGHDMERWMLKTMAAMAVSKNLARKRVPLTQLHASIDLADLLQSPKSWQTPRGLFLANSIGQPLKGFHYLDISPISNRSTGEIVGIIAKIRGLIFLLLAADHPIAGTNIDKTIYRPGRIVFENRAVISTIEFSWEDRLAHDDCICTLGNRDSVTGQIVPVV